MKTGSSGDLERLQELVRLADAEDLQELVLHLAGMHPGVREECCSFLGSRMPTAGEAAARAVFFLWDELEPDLEELDTRGGGDEEQEDQVDYLLGQVIEKLAEGQVPREDRRALLDEVIPYIASGNSGMDDSLYDVAYAACYDDEDLRDLAGRLEALEKPWPLEHARRIYRRIGDRDKYLALRALKMEYGTDYYDLELRQFLAERALEAGDRAGYLELQFAQATESLTEAGYRAFRELCSHEEWREYEPRVLAVLEQVPAERRLMIHLVRKEYDLAAGILARMRYPREGYGEGSLLRAAAQLETRYPEQVLAFYMTGLGSLNSSGTRKEYARNARVVLKLRHMWVDVLGQPNKWQAFAQEVKAQNQNRPAFHEEFACVIPDWREM
ncbi:MAG TPA: hypothetical protein GX513_01050 [Firmicutes bacterium]|nr:hypothetical protein [Bacillota bacterium]